MDELVCMLVFEADNQDYKPIINSAQGKQYGFDNCTTIRTPEGKILFCYLETDETEHVAEHTIQLNINDTNITLAVRHMIFTRSFCLGLKNGKKRI